MIGKEKVGNGDSVYGIRIIRPKQVRERTAKWILLDPHF